MTDDPNRLDEARLAPWLERHVAGFHGFEGTTKFGQGQSNPTYAVHAASGTYVLRAKPPGRLLPSAHQVDREHRVMAALAATPVPVPRMLALCRADGGEGEESPIGRTFFVMEHVDGRVLWDPALPDETPEARAAIYDAMNTTLAALHDVDPQAVGLSDFGRPGNYFARQTGRWAGQYRDSEVERLEAAHELIAWLDAHMPADDGRSCIVHGDYRIDNMMFAPAGTDVVAVLDWELSTLGHPFADLAYQVMQWQLPNEGQMRGLAGVDRAAAGIPDDDAYVTRYCERRGLEPPANWDFYVAFSFFRLAAILQGVYKRALDGNASNPERAARVGAAVPALVQMGLART